MELKDLTKYGANAFLVGESLMSSKDIKSATTKLIKKMNFTHIKNKKNVNMVDISKNVTKRTACARSLIKFTKKTFNKVISDNSPKGEIFTYGEISRHFRRKKLRINSSLS